MEAQGKVVHMPDGPGATGEAGHAAVRLRRSSDMLVTQRSKIGPGHTKAGDVVAPFAKVLRAAWAAEDLEMGAFAESVQRGPSSSAARRVVR